MYFSMADDQNIADLFWDDLDATQLLTVLTILMRAAASLRDRFSHVEDRVSSEALRDEIFQEALQVHCTLMHKCSIISDDQEFILGTYQVMGLAPRTQRLLEGYKNPS